MKYYMLYAKLPGQKRFQPVDWRGKRQVRLRIRATMFKAENIPRLKDIIHKETQEKGRLDGITSGGFWSSNPRDPCTIVKWNNIQWELRQC
jgi:hypothetical protein